MDQCLVRLVKEGKIDYETAKPFVYDKFTHETLKNIPRPFQPGRTPNGIHPV